jgi:hypothetical protein
MKTMFYSWDRTKINHNFIFEYHESNLPHNTCTFKKNPTTNFSNVSADDLFWPTEACPASDTHTHLKLLCTSSRGSGEPRLPRCDKGYETVPVTCRKVRDNIDKKYLDLMGRKRRQSEEICLNSSFLVCSLHRSLLGWSKGKNMGWHAVWVTKTRLTELWTKK